MVEIVYLREIQAARRRGRVDHRESLEMALAILKENLAAVASRLAEAPRAEQSELLDRVEKLAMLVRYAMRMLGEPNGPRLDAATTESR
jgi:hypothetical protein